MSKLKLIFLIKTAVLFSVCPIFSWADNPVSPNQIPDQSSTVGDESLSSGLGLAGPLTLSAFVGQTSTYRTPVSSQRTHRTHSPAFWGLDLNIPLSRRWLIGLEYSSFKYETSKPNNVLDATLGKNYSVGTYANAFSAAIRYNASLFTFGGHVSALHITQHYDPGFDLFNTNGFKSTDTLNVRYVSLYVDVSLRLSLFRNVFAEAGASLTHPALTLVKPSDQTISQQIGQIRDGNARDEAWHQFESFKTMNVYYLALGYAF